MTIVFSKRSRAPRLATTDAAMDRLYAELATPTHEFIRRNAGDARNEPPTKITEGEAIVYLSAVLKDPQRAISRLKKGKVIETRYATYSARPI